MKRLFTVFFSLTLLIMGGCTLNDDEPNFHFVPLTIVSAEVPDSFQLNQTYQILVNYEVPDGCTSFSGFDVSESATATATRNVVVFGATRTDQEACTQVVTEQQASFNFICQYDQTYLFRFWQGESADGEQEYFEVEVPVGN